MTRSSAGQLRSSPPFGVLPLFLTMIIHCGSQPILPSLSYPVFVLTPQLSQQSESSTSSIPEEGFEVSQFHSQDELGRVVFGFHGPDQSRMEARSLDGSVRGSYSYIDPYGHIVKMQYWDDGSGFHVAGNALPRANLPYTPEVAAAREQHFKIYKQTLAAAQQHPAQSDENAYADSPDNDPSISISQFEDQKEHQDNSLYEGDKESISLENPELNGNHNVYQEDEGKEEKNPGIQEVEGEVDLGEDVGPDEDIDEEGYENDQPEVSNHKYSGENEKEYTEYDDDADHIIIVRHKHSTSNEDKEEEEKQDKNDDEEYEHIKDSDENPDRENSEEERSDSIESQENETEHEEEKEIRGQLKENTKDQEEQEFESEEDEEHYDPEISENRNSDVRLVIAPIAQPQTVTTNFEQKEQLEKVEDQITDNSDTKTKMIVTPTKKQRAFFYHFQHTIPKPTERIDEAVEKGLESADNIKVPPSAVHDSQLSPYHFINFPLPQE